MTDCIFQRWQQQNLSHALVWLWQSSYWELGFNVPSPESEQVCDHSKSDSVWLLKLEASYSATLRNAFSWNPATSLWGSISNHLERPLFQLIAPTEVPADSQHQIAKDVSKWALRCQATPAFESAQQRPETSQSRQANPLCPFKFQTQRTCGSKK